MAGTLFIPPSKALDANANPYAGAKWTFYTTGTTTPQSVYTTAALSVAHNNPVVADSSGKFANIFFDPAIIYRGILTNSDGSVTLHDIDPISDNVLASISDPTGSSLVGFRQAGTGAVARTAQAKMRERVSVSDFLGVLSTTAAIQAAIDAATSELLVDGVYTISSQLNLKSNLAIVGTAGAKLVQEAGISGYMLRLSGLTNVTIRDLAIEGNGEASGDSSIYLSGCSDVLFDNVTVTKSRSIGIWCVSSSNVNVTNSNLSSNYAYGLEFRDSDGCRAIGNLCANNGETGIASSTGGRGIMLWRSRGCYIAGNRLITNTEYGFRLYSEAADATTSYGNVITGNVMLDNTRTDFVIYDEGASFSFVARNTISDNIAYRTTNTTLGQVYLLHGDYNTYTNNQAYKIGAFGTDVGFNFFNANYCTLIGSTAQNMAQGVSTSSSANIVIDNFLGDTVAQGVTNPTTGIVVKNSRFIHGGAGATDVCINNTGATGKNFYEGNRISGFYRGVSLADEAVAIFRNTTTGSTDVGLFKSGNITDVIEADGNSWDSANPFLLSAYRRNVSTHSRAEITFPAAPTALTWVVGDRQWNATPLVGGSMGNVCTTAGTPGTWRPMPGVL